MWSIAARWCLTAASAALVAGCQTDAQTSVPAPAVVSIPHPNSINGQLSRPWHHVGTGVSAQRQAEDEAKCKVTANMTGPSATDIKYYVTYINCLRAAGYEPDAPK